MKKSLFVNTLFGSSFGIIAFIAGNSFAQNQMQSPKMGMVFTTNAQECSIACSNDLLCAAWAFKAIKVGKNEATTGQCQFSNTANISKIDGAITGLPSRNKTSDLGFSSNITPKQSDTYKSAVLKTGNGQIYQGNYGVKPLTYGPPAKIATNQPIALNVPPPPPQNIIPKDNNAIVSFEKPKTIEAYKAPVNVTPPVVKAQPVNIEIPKVKTEAKAEVKKSLGPIHASGYTKKELSVDEQKAFVGKDGMIDAAEMRRYELKYGAKKTGGQYSVQKEWNEVAEAMKNGENNSDIDWTKTKPVLIAENSEKQAIEKETVKEKKSLFGFLNRKNESETTEIQMPSKGPLRKKTAQSEDPIY